MRFILEIRNTLIVSPAGIPYRLLNQPGLRRGLNAASGSDQVTG